MSFSAADIEGSNNFATSVLWGERFIKTSTQTDNIPCQFQFPPNNTIRRVSIRQTSEGDIHRFCLRAEDTFTAIVEYFHHLVYIVI